MKLRREAAHQLPFEQACEHIYDQSFYPLVTHFTFAFQSSAVARLRFVRRIAAAMAFSEALTNEAEFNALCREVGLSVQSLSSKWHLTFGDDPRHLFAVAQLEKGSEPAADSVYSLPPPQISSAASSGIVIS